MGACCDKPKACQEGCTSTPCPVTVTWSKQKSKLVKAERDIIGVEPGDLSVSSGDLLFVWDDAHCDARGSEYYVNALSIRTLATGLVPNAAVTGQDLANSRLFMGGEITNLRSLVCRIHGSSRSRTPGATIGATRWHFPADYALTLKAAPEEVKHYKITYQSGEFYICCRYKFPTVHDLVAHYSDGQHGLEARLVCPAPKPNVSLQPRPQRNHPSASQNWQIARDELRLTEIIGSGHFGEVWYAKWRNVVEVGVKTLKTGTMSSQEFLAEAQIMQSCDHPNMVKLFGVCTDTEPFYIVTEYMQKGSLHDYLHKNESNISFKHLIDICKQVARGMEYMELKHLVHRDLAARNVLVGDIVSDAFPVVKVADFGLTKSLMASGRYYKAHKARFPLLWTAPEAALKLKFSIKSDVWSFGVLLFEIVTKGDQPYIGIAYDDLITKLLRGYRMPRPDGCDVRFYECMLRCWHKTPDQRPGFRCLRLFFENYFTEANAKICAQSEDY